MNKLVLPSVDTSLMKGLDLSLSFFSSNLMNDLVKYWRICNLLYNWIIQWLVVTNWRTLNGFQGKTPMFASITEATSTVPGLAQVLPPFLSFFPHLCRYCVCVLSDFSFLFVLESLLFFLAFLWLTLNFNWFLKYRRRQKPDVSREIHIHADWRATGIRSCGLE